MLNVRVVTVDYYLSRPIKELDSTCRSVRTSHWNEPVIRIFGPTSDGIKTCINIHGVYPYIYVPYRGGDNPERDALLLGAALDQALAMNPNSKNSKFVYKVVLASGIPLYGYHSRPRQFLKIYFFNPVHVKKASDLLLSGAILGQRLQPHEAHIPYTLQFMIDYNIHGMSFVTLDRVKYRMSPADPDSLRGIDKADILPAHVKRTSHSYWEVDALAEDIANRRERGGASVNPGLEAIWEDEKSRRRARDRASQITPQISQSRGEMKITANELMHKQRLAQKLRDAIPEEEVPPSVALPEAGPSLSYPAEVPDDVVGILEASAVDASLGEPPPEDLLGDVADLIDERILTRLSAAGDREEAESEEERAKAADDSILGRNRGDDDGAEPDDEDGGDMTQPLEMLESVIHGDCLSDRVGRGIDCCSDSEDEFWKEMANKIMQLDGTDDLSSLDSDEETKKSVGRADAAAERILGAGSPGSESAWSSSIMSILNEGSSFSGAHASYQTPHTFWSNWSDSNWAPQSDSWSWDKNEASILDCLSYASKKDKIPEEEVSFPRARAASETATSGDFYAFPVASHGDYYHGNFTPTSTMSPVSNVGSACNISPPSTILTPSSEMDNYSDINLDSVCETTSQISNSPSPPQEDAKSANSPEVCARGQIMEAKTVTVPKSDAKATALNANRKDLLALLRNFSKSCGSPEKGDDRVKMLSLVLKQYIKTCGEILNVDFKSLSGKEMIVVEYRPINSKSNQNKFLIKPLDKFLEDWNSVEKLGSFRGKTADEQADWPRYINGFADARENAEEEKQLSAILKTLENKYTGSWLDESRIKSIKNKFIVKSIEMIPDESGEKLVKNYESDKTYKVNESVVSEGKIKMKLIKDRKGRKMRKDLLDSSSVCAPTEGSAPERKESVGANSFHAARKTQAKPSAPPDAECSRQRDRTAKKSRNDKELIDEINRSFESYFRKMRTRVRGTPPKSEDPDEHSVEEEEEEEEEDAEDAECAEDAEDAEEEEESTSGEEGNGNPDPGSDGASAGGSSDAVKFVTQILSALTSLSRSTSMPPLSITINVGNCRNSPSVHFNFHTGGKLSQRKRRSERMLIDSVDGPADSSSSDDSGEAKEAARTPNRKRQKKDSAYAAPDVATGQKAPRDADADRRKRKLPLARNLADELIGGCATSSGVSSLDRRGWSSGKRVAEASKNRKEKGSDPNVEPGTGQKIEAEDLTRFGEEDAGNPRQLARIGQDLVNKVDSSPATNESDFIGDSDSEISERRKRKKRRGKTLRKWRRANPVDFIVPQTDVVSSSESDEALSLISKALQRLKKVVSESEEASQSPKQAQRGTGGGISAAAATAEVPAAARTDELTDREEDASGTSRAILELSPSPHADGSRSSSDRGTDSHPGREPFALSQELVPIAEASFLREVAANSDDSLKPEESPEAVERDISPFDLSGPSLHRGTPTDDSPVGFARSRTGSPDGPSSEGKDFRCVTQFPRGDGRVIQLLTGLPTTMTPQTKPPSFLEVRRTLKDFAIPEAIAQVPFYSDPRDISNPVEVGGRLLKIENYSIAGLRTHVSALNLFGIEALAERALNLRQSAGKGSRSMRSALVGDRKVTIVPVLKPPARREVSDPGPGTKAERLEPRESAKARVTVPKSPGQNSDSSDELDLSVTLSCSPGGEGKGSGRTEGSEGERSPDPWGGSRTPGRESAGSSPTFPDDLLCSTPRGAKPFSPSPGSRRKGVKRVSRLQTIAEGEQLEICEAQEREGSSLEERKCRAESSFEIRGVSPDNTYGFKSSAKCLQKARMPEAHELVTMLVMELHVRTRGALRPDPRHDPVRALFYTVFTHAPGEGPRTGIVAVGEGILAGTAAPQRDIHYVPDEVALLDKAVELLRVWDPDILAGYEIEMHSWGYLFQRAASLGKSIFLAAGRAVDDARKWKEPTAETGEKEWDDVPRYLRHMSVTGRIVLDIWRLLRHEVALTSYTFENVMYHLVHERHPRHSYRLLSHFWEHESRRLRHITVEYYVTRVEGVVRLLEQLDFIGCNSELARLFGIQFFEVFSRGSQFRVESMMLRLAKPLNYVACSPSIRQRAAMRAPASLPLIMEPESMFYADPVIVLDFQSLYPSMIIAYNYCFSTCLGRVELLGRQEPFEFGCTCLQISPEELKRLEGDVHVSPAGVAFVRANVRKGVLPSMLEEILETRLMVKKSMKDYRGDRILQKVLHARQLGLKLIANVTYGYTAANFSGRMPSIEVGDSIVSKGRETLQRAIEMVRNTPRWGARVVYGDTDSLFVLVPGKTRAEAFRIGGEIAEAVTLDNPKPVKLKLEKVYQPSILQTKKRYVGYMYESPDQERPVYDAKGIETVRRDGCPATGKILQKALQILFDTRDVSLVKKYAVRQFAKIFRGRVNVQDLTFAKEYRGRHGYRPGACVPALQLAKQWTQTDRRAEPRVKERVPYVIVNGPPGLPLIRLVRSPRDLFEDPNLRINAVYYITKAIIPPMQRCFSLLGADVGSWYAEMPRKYHRVLRETRTSESRKRATISQYFASVDCAVCCEATATPVCDKCRGDDQKVAAVFAEKIRVLQRRRDAIAKICGSCCGRTTATDCESLDCPVLYRRHRALRDSDQIAVLRRLSEELLA